MISILQKLLNAHFVHDANDSQLTKSIKRVLSGDLSQRYTNDKLQLLTKPGSSKKMESCSSLEDQLDTEIYQYKGEEHTDKSPLLWWSSFKGRYPLFTQLAKHYLAIPATSVSCERVFSEAGHVVNKKRSCLLPSNVNMLVFLAENLK